MKVGLSLTPTVYDPETRRAVCGRCKRHVATGQTACICGAQFEGLLKSEPCAST